MLSGNGVIVLQRWDEIRAVVEQRGKVTVEELAERFGVSGSTIRRDLVEMQRRGLVVRARGGAVTARPVAFDRPLSESGTLYVEFKEKLGAAAAALVSAGETVMLDAGSTTYQVASRLPGGVTLVTNSFDSARAAMRRGDVQVLMIGGLAQDHPGATVGPGAELQIRSFRADVAVLGINGISPEAGLTTPNVLVAQIKRAMIAQSRRLVVVADHTKVGVETLCQVAHVRDVEILVTDSGADGEVIEAIEAEGVRVIVVG